MDFGGFSPFQTRSTNNRDIKHLCSPQSMGHGCHPSRLKKHNVPSGKCLHNYGKSPSLIGKSNINVAFSIATLNYQESI